MSEDNLPFQESLPALEAPTYAEHEAVVEGLRGAHYALFQLEAESRPRVDRQLAEALGRYLRAALAELAEHDPDAVRAHRRICLRDFVRDHPDHVDVILSRDIEARRRRFDDDELGVLLGSRNEYVRRKALRILGRSEEGGQGG